ncbi:hypothetical protein [Entomohabitans teleogrylli]|uniref:hypothetical protein n=1 Tax=Entomohabitans teleogrylli TaxID=1384589 RepID=UPI00073D8A79|nr:hypothetical protein [Entomohabitans teleogrylli]
MFNNQFQTPYMQQLENMRNQLNFMAQQPQMTYPNPAQYQQPYQNQYQQPFMQPQQAPQQQMPQPVPNIQQLIQQEVQRQLSLQQQPQPAVINQTPAPAQPAHPAVAVLNSIGGQMTVNDQQWLSANLNGLPGFFATQDGKEVIQLALSGFKKHMGIADE